MWNDQLFKLVAIGYIKPWFNAVSMGLLWNVWTGSLIEVLRTYIWNVTRSQDHRFFNCPCSLFHYSSISFHRFSQFPFQSNTFDTDAVNDDDFYYYRSAPFHQLHYKWLFGVIFQNDVGWCSCALDALGANDAHCSSTMCLFNKFQCVQMQSFKWNVPAFAQNLVQTAVNGAVRATQFSNRWKLHMKNIDAKDQILELMNQIEKYAVHMVDDSAVICL